MKRLQRWLWRVTGAQALLDSSREMYAQAHAKRLKLVGLVNAALDAMIEADAAQAAYKSCQMNQHLEAERNARTSKMLASARAHTKLRHTIRAVRKEVGR